MTLRYRLRTLSILLAILPPLLWIGWTKYEAWRAEQARQDASKRLQWTGRRNIVGPLPDWIFTALPSNMGPADDADEHERLGIELPQ